MLDGWIGNGCCYHVIVIIIVLTATLTWTKNWKRVQIHLKPSSHDCKKSFDGWCAWDLLPRNLFPVTQFLTILDCEEPILRSHLFWHWRCSRKIYRQGRYLSLFWGYTWSFLGLNLKLRHTSHVTTQNNRKRSRISIEMVSEVNLKTLRSFRDHLGPYGIIWGLFLV